MPLAAFALVLAPPLLAGLGLVAGGWVAWIVPALAWLGVPLAELALPERHHNASPAEASARRGDRRFDLILIGLVPLQLALVVLLAARIGSLSALAAVGAVLAVGTCGGAIGINVAHELGHRANRTYRALARILLFSTLYAHFFVEHNRGHHARVATPGDPASAHEAESLYGFLVRSVVGGWRHAWQLEVERLEAASKRPWTLKNEVLLGMLAEVAFVAAIAGVFGAGAAVAVVAAAGFGVATLEAVNYVEHYGLSRARLDDGRYERVAPAHSWTSDHPLSRTFLLELTRHADHHAHPNRPYPVLRHLPEAPQLPTGYPGMVLLALAPPLFRRVMHPRLRDKEAGRPASVLPEGASLS